jgi:hypothetical protein
MRFNQIYFWSLFVQYKIKLMILKAFIKRCFLYFEKKSYLNWYLINPQFNHQKKNLIPKHNKFLNMSNWLCLCLWWGALFHGLTLEEEPDYMGLLSITYMNLFFFSNGLMQLVRTQFSFENFSRILHSYPSILY